ncbi:MAG: DUF3883 domain-containing protein [Gemmatimonadetes bacterium]|nr:DUF3883 domain-containing protein [Gemmatimonadota bacterium]
MNFERARLSAARKPRLADRVEHVADTRGDGLGYDVLSFEESGKERLIEVKTTKFGIHTPFLITRNEVRVSDSRRDHYALYRVFGFRKEPKLYALPGSVRSTSGSTPWCSKHAHSDVKGTSGILGSRTCRGVSAADSQWPSDRPALTAQRGAPRTASASARRGRCERCESLADRTCV